MIRDRRWGRTNPFAMAVGLYLTALAFAPEAALAVPSFVRQTGLPCAACHTVAPELTPFGRQFKLRGYTMGQQLKSKPFPYDLPLAMGLQLGNTQVKDRNKGADASTDFPRADKTIVQQVAFYYGGAIYGKLGALAQFNWDGIGQAWGVEMADIRYADSTVVKGNELIYGITVNNSPAVEDVWNTSPMWFFPHLRDAGIAPMITSLMDMTLDNQVGGVGLYVDYDSQLYLEAGVLRNGHTSIFRPLNAGDPLTTAVEGTAPHLRIAWEKDWGANSAEVGMHALRANIFPDPQQLSGPTDRFTDLVLDGQYQHIGQQQLFSVHALFDHEKRDWNASLPLGLASSASDTLDTVKASAHYWYERKVGGGIGYFDYWGDRDMLKYGMSAMPSGSGDATGSPDTRGWTVEADYLPLEDSQNLKIGLRYTLYAAFNGRTDDYNGFGRSASDNDALFLYLWALY